MTTADRFPPAGVPRRWLAFSAALAAMLMELLDATVSSTAGPAIRANLGGSYADLQWIGAGYTLALTLGLLTGGRLGDLFGRKRMLLIGVAGFTTASLLCAIAPTVGFLIAARVLQGAVGAVLVPQVFGVIRDLFPPAEMGKAFTVLGPCAGLTAVLGPIMAGLLIDVNLFGTDWRMVFGINVPVGLFALVVGTLYLPAVAPIAATRRLDLPGTALAAAGTSMLVYPLVQGRELGWPVWSVLLLAGSVPVLAAFGWTQLRRTRSGKTTLIEPSVFTKRSYVSGAAFATVFLASMGGIMFTLGVLLQVGLGYTPIHAALTTAPFALGGFIGSAIGGMTMARLGRTVVQIGIIVMGLGIGWLSLVIGHAHPTIGSWAFFAPLLVAGIGMGSVFVPMFDIILGGVGDHEIGSASGILQSLQQLGTSLGIAGLGTLFFSLLGPAAAVKLGFLHAAHQTILVTLALIVLACGLAFLLPRRARADAAEWAADAAEAPAAEPEAVTAEPEAVLV
jgi:EmrB/QacA subfamily drug resistance transporter